MNEVLIYMIKVVVIQGILFGFYGLFLRKSLKHSWNRFYLLIAILLSFSIPFIDLSTQTPIEPIPTDIIFSWVEESAGEYKLIPVESISNETVSFWSFSLYLYVTIVLFLVGRSIYYLIFLQKLKKHSEYVKKRWFKLFKTSQTHPFSFFSNVFIPKDVFGSNAFDHILAHECVHVKQRHSIDRLLMDFLVSLFWFNPFIYLYRNALIEIHEFQADEAVINQFNDLIGYQEVLYSQLQHATYSGLVSHFNFSMIKKRIVMMNKQKSRYAGLLYALTLPVLVSVIFAFSSKEAIEPIEHVGIELAEILSPEPSFQLSTFDLPEIKVKETKVVQQNDIPSILPIRDADKARHTSGFGMRMHPLLKVEKMHKGMDFSCPVGTAIIAPADGIVKNVEPRKDGYGNLLTLSHGDGIETRYAQLSEFKVEVGDRVQKGEEIALSGNSGYSTAPHLHYEVIKNGEHVDPIDYIKDYAFKSASREASDKAKKEAKLAEKVRNDAEFAKRQAEIEREKAEQAAYQAEIEKENELRRKEKEMALEEARLAEEKEKSEKEKIVKEKEKVKAKEKNKTKSKNKSDNHLKGEVERLSKVYEFLEKYDGEKFDKDNWIVVLKSDRVKLKRVGSLEGIVLFNAYFEED